MVWGKDYWDDTKKHLKGNKGVESPQKEMDKTRILLINNRGSRMEGGGGEEAIYESVWRSQDPFTIN